MFALKPLFVGLLALASGASALSSTLQPITANFGANPTGVKMFMYKPTKLASPPPLIVAIHWCHGVAQDYFAATSLASLADTHGFLLIFPNAPSSDGCWDVASAATLTHNGGGDSLAIANVVRWAISSQGVDAKNVFATGTSSGAMMTNVLMGAYPDLFKAGSLYSGVPYGCFAGPDAWNTQCATGLVVKTPQQWGDQVRAGFPGFTGTRPKVQFWHGTVDAVLYPQNFWEEIKQWTNIFGVSQTPTSNLTSNPQAGYSRASYGPNVQAILAQGVGHTVPEHETDTLAWFGLSNLTPGGSAPSTTSTTPPHTTTSTAPSSTPTGGGGTAAHYAQCGGTGFTGPTVCAAPYKCTYSNPYYSQCL